MSQIDKIDILKKTAKYLAVIIGTIGILLGIALLGLNLLFKDMCGNDVTDSYVSPNEKYKLIIFQRDCGATSGFSTQISIIKNRKKVPNKSGNVFVADGHPNTHSIHVAWKDNKEVILTGNTSTTYLKNTMVKGIKITYKNK